LNTVHIIDSDSRRRATFSRELQARRLHAEIYESLEEFALSKPQNGFVMIHDEANGDDPSTAIQSIASIGPLLPVVFYNIDPKLERVVALVKEGATDYLAWPLSPELFDRALERLIHNSAGELARRQAAFQARIRVERLSKRERQVLLEMLNGLTNLEIAKSLGLSPRTVEIHRGNMMKKLGATSPARAARTALEAGLSDEADHFATRRTPITCKDMI
jgi:FixJ family two-component response regulator